MKIQSQLEQIDIDLVNRLSQIILKLAETLYDFIIGFITSWKLSLVICASFSIIIIYVVISDYFPRAVGCIIEELLFNIKTST